MTTKTDQIRAKLATIQSAATDIGTLCDEIDAAGNSPQSGDSPDAGNSPNTGNSPNSGDSPAPKVIPTGVNCLNGTTPAWTSANMITAELNETPWINARSAHAAELASVPNGSILLIGDSQLSNMDEALISPYAWNGGIPGESSRQWLYRVLNDSVLRTKAQNAGALVIETFVNDLGDSGTYSSQQNCLDTVIPYMLPKIVNWLSGKCVIICPTKVNVASGFWTQNSTIETFNTALKNACAGKSHIKVIDLNPTIAPVTSQYPYGSLLAQYNSGDGHHLSAAGFALKANAVKTELLALGLTAQNLA